ncbi:hypothetical protein, partial [Pseudomonas aeruginosa]|uniref:hypothetical protein n=1 Tax=Pseudomonas aeruginosa TaxID=287 RepID=UPI003BF597B1
MLRRKTKSVERQGWRDPSEQGRVSGFPLCRLSRRPGLKEDGLIFSGDDADFADRDVSAPFRSVRYQPQHCSKTSFPGVRMWKKIMVICCMMAVSPLMARPSQEITPLTEAAEQQ